MRLLALLSVLVGISSSTSTSEKQVTAYLEADGNVTVKLGIDTKNGCATAQWQPLINETGWSNLIVDGSNHDGGAYCAGFLEGYLSQGQIKSMFDIVYSDWFRNGVRKPKVAMQVRSGPLIISPSSSLTLSWQYRVLSR